MSSVQSERHPSAGGRLAPAHAQETTHEIRTGMAGWRSDSTDRAVVLSQSLGLRLLNDATRRAHVVRLRSQHTRLAALSQRAAVQIQSRARPTSGADCPGFAKRRTFTCEPMIRRYPTCALRLLMLWTAHKASDRSRMAAVDIHDEPDRLLPAASNRDDQRGYS